MKYLWLIGLFGSISLTWPKLDPNLTHKDQILIQIKSNLIDYTHKLSLLNWLWTNGHLNLRWSSWSNLTHAWSCLIKMGYVSSLAHLRWHEPTSIGPNPSLDTLREVATWLPLHVATSYSNSAKDKQRRYDIQ